MARKKHSNRLKARVALDAIKGQNTANELASQYEVHPTQINQWKKQVVDNAEALFARAGKTMESDHEKEKEKLYGQIGKLQVELEWLKKKCKQLGVL